MQQTLEYRSEELPSSPSVYLNIWSTVNLKIVAKLQNNIPWKKKKKVILAVFYFIPGSLIIPNPISVEKLIILFFFSPSFSGLRAFYAIEGSREIIGLLDTWIYAWLLLHS